MRTGLASKVVVVTGGASGIGLSCARSFVEEGASVVIADLREEEATRASQELGGGATAIPVDVTDQDSARGLCSETVERLGGIDVLVTCAGVFHATPFAEIPLEEWQRIITVNLTGTFLTAQAALEVMVPRRSGRIITIASLAGQAGGLAAGAAYASSKAGVVALTKSIARYAGRYGITANAVNPGVIDTPMIQAWPEGVRDGTVAATPLGRVGTAEEVAAVVVMLASDGASFVHGAQVDVNGGLLMA